MNKKIQTRVNSIANHILSTNDTIRETAKVFGVSKSTVHKDIGERLLELDDKMYYKIKEIMIEHNETRHIKGGESTRQLFLEKKKVML